MKLYHCVYYYDQITRTNGDIKKKNKKQNHGPIPNHMRAFKLDGGFVPWFFSYYITFGFFR